MHIEPGVVSGAKIILSYATAFAALGITAQLALKTIFLQKTSDSFHQKNKDAGIISLVARSLRAHFDLIESDRRSNPLFAARFLSENRFKLFGKRSIATALVFTFFEIFPHHPVGVSEVHLILGSTLFLIFGAAPTAIGLTLGLLLQGLFFAPFDLPQYGMNITTLLMPLFVMAWLADKIIPQNTAYKDISYKQALALSTSYQGGIVAWVAFWAFYGEGFSSQTAVNIGSFAIAYMSVVLVEPLIDLGVLFIAKSLHKLSNSPFIQQRLYQAIT